MAADNSINPLASFTDGDLEELKAGMASIDNTSDMHLLVLSLIHIYGNESILFNVIMC